MVERSGGRIEDGSIGKPRCDAATVCAVRQGPAASRNPQGVVASELPCDRAACEVILGQPDADRRATGDKSGVEIQQLQSLFRAP
jgi:hypothetical protein